jgi:hypothetical protein
MEAGTVFHWQPGDRVTVRYAGYKNDGLIYDARYKDGVIEAFDERLPLCGGRPKIERRFFGTIGVPMA